MNNENNDKAEALEINEVYEYITYLIGSMEKCAEKDDGTQKRAAVEAELLLRKVYPINPVRLETQKTGMDTAELKEKMSGWLASGNWELFREKAVEIWKGIKTVDENLNIVNIPGDIDYCTMSDWLTFTYNKGDVPCGSFAECGIAMEHDIPIFLITDMPKKELPKSLLQMILITNGEVFNSLKEYLEYIDKVYKLKRKETKENKS